MDIPKKTFLFFPVEIGLAHIVRSLALAEELYSRGHKIFFALPQRKRELFKSSPINFVNIEPYLKNDSINLEVFSNIDFLKNKVIEEIEIIEKYKPDAIIVDFRFSAMASSLIKNIPTFCIMVGNAMPYGSYLPNTGLSRWQYILSKPFLGIFQTLAFLNYLKPIKKVLHKYNIGTSFKKWFRKMNYIIPEPDFYLTPRDKKLNYYHTGFIAWKGFNVSAPEWIKNINPDGKTVYLTFGGTGFDKGKLISLANTLVDKGYRVVVSTSTIADPEDFPKKNGLFVARFLPGEEMSRRVDIVICHGGYGTMMDAIRGGAPILAIPFNADQIIHSARMQELGIARNLGSLKIFDLKAAFLFDWKYFEKKAKKIEIVFIVSELRRMFKNIEKYKESIKNFNEKYPNFDGAKQVADIIENKV